MATILDGFDSVRIINLVDRTDRRREIDAQLARVGAADHPDLAFFPARRPPDAGPFPSIGARGCFESHLSILREALRTGCRRLLIVEDDLDFGADIAARGDAIASALDARRWGLFYGAPILSDPVAPDAAGDAAGLASVAPDQAIMTTSCVGFSRAAMVAVEAFLTAMLARPPGSPDFGPMHVDGAYSVFRRLHPDTETLICIPPIGEQRSSRSDITPNRFILDRFAATHPLANALRRTRALLKR